MLNFMTKEEAERSFRHAQEPHDAGVKFATKVATLAYFSEAREFAKNSKTAQAILKYVEGAKTVINFVGLYGGFQCFDEEAPIGHALGPKQPTIWVDLNGKLKVLVRTPHEMHLPRNRITSPDMRPFENKVALLHELGHAKQFIERPSWYRLYVSDTEKAKWRLAIEKRAEAMWLSKLTPKAQGPANGASSGGLPPPPPGPSLGGMSPSAQVRAILPTTTQKAAKQSWAVVVDIDNMARHEWPICRELGLPVRMNYTDLAV